MGLLPSVCFCGLKLKLRRWKEGWLNEVLDFTPPLINKTPRRAEDRALHGWVGLRLEM